MDDDQQFCLRWNNHQSTLISVFDTLLENETLVDCTLAAEGKFLKAHKVVLSACSPYFATLLQEQYDKHPIFILKDVKYQELRAMMDYMYRGEVNISQDQLAALLKAAESLQIKGLSDNRTGGGNSSGGGVPKHDQHRGLSVPGSSGVLGGGKLSSGYTLEQTKRARMGPSSIDSQDMSGSREGSSSPTSRRRRKVRRRSIENALADVHDNSNSSQIQPNASSALLQQSNASLGGVGAITAAASALASQVPVSAATLPSAAAAAVSASTIATTTQGTTQQLTTATNVTKKTESVKGTSGGDALHTELLVHGGAGGNLDEQQQQHGGLELKSEKLNHKQQKSVLGVGNVKDTSSAAELVIEPKSEYDDDGNDETVEDLTLDDEDMGMEDLDHNAGTSHGNEGSSQGYAQWQHDRSQDEVFMATQEAQQRDPQDIYPILGSLLGVDTNTNDHSNDDLYTFINNNSMLAPTVSLGVAAGAMGNVGGETLLERNSFMQCRHCQRYYKSHQKLQEHVRKYCLKEKKYKCVSCEYRSRRKDHVLRHAKRKHCELYAISAGQDEESLYEIRNEDEEKYDDLQMIFGGDTGGIGGVGDGNVGGFGGPADNDVDLTAAAAAASGMGSFVFDFGNRDLTITAVPILQESDDDDDDYDDDGPEVKDEAI